jgi:hypothetical protein
LLYVSISLLKKEVVDAENEPAALSGCSLRNGSGCTTGQVPSTTVKGDVGNVRGETELGTERGNRERITRAPSSVFGSGKVSWLDKVVAVVIVVATGAQLPTHTSPGCKR